MSNTSFVALDSTPKMKLVIAEDQPQIPEQIAAPCQKNWSGYFKVTPTDDGKLTVILGADDLACVTIEEFADRPIDLPADPNDPNGGGTYRTVSRTFDNVQAGYYFVNISYTNVSGVAQNLSQLTIEVNGEPMQIGELQEVPTIKAYATLYAESPVSGPSLSRQIALIADVEGEGENTQITNVRVGEYDSTPLTYAGLNGTVTYISIESVSASFVTDTLVRPNLNIAVRRARLYWTVRIVDEQSEDNPDTIYEADTSYNLLEAQFYTPLN